MEHEPFNLLAITPSANGPDKRRGEVIFENGNFFICYNGREYEYYWLSVMPHSDLHAVLTEKMDKNEAIDSIVVVPTIAKFKGWFTAEIYLRSPKTTKEDYEKLSFFGIF